MTTWIWIILAILYVLSRVDLIPDVIAGWGWIDDIVVLAVLYRYLRRTAGWRRPTPRPGEEPHQSGAQREPGPKDPYEILGIVPGANSDEIRAAYRRLAGQYHPDKVTHLGQDFQNLAETRFKEIQQAYDQLMKKK